VSFVEALQNAAAAGVELIRDPASQTLRATRADDWDLWVSDAGLLRALLREVDALGVRSVALWRLGQEDPTIWREIVR
jgi:ATP phosphoribosyltransferase regulatory subunit HisZ